MYIVSQESPIEHDEVLRECAIEPLDERVLLGRAHVGIEVGESENGTRLLEEESELTPIVRLELVNLEWTDFDDSFEEVSSTLR